MKNGAFSVVISDTPSGFLDDVLGWRLLVCF